MKLINSSDVPGYNKTKSGIDLIGDIDGLKVANYQDVGKHIASRLKDVVGDGGILEVCCGIGSTTFVLASHFTDVYAVDMNPARITAAKTNIRNLRLHDRVEFYTSDIFSQPLINILAKKRITAVYTDVEWTTSGIYGQDHATNISDTSPNTERLYKCLKENLTGSISMRLPKNINKDQLRSLDKCEIEKVFKNGELIFVNVYFGKLVRQKSSRFGFSI